MPWQLIIPNNSHPVESIIFIPTAGAPLNCDGNVMVNGNVAVEGIVAIKTH